MQWLLIGIEDAEDVDGAVSSMIKVIRKGSRFMGLQRMFL